MAWLCSWVRLCSLLVILCQPPSMTLISPSQLFCITSCSYSSLRFFAKSKNHSSDLRFPLHFPPSPLGISALYGFLHFSLFLSPDCRLFTPMLEANIPFKPHSLYSGFYCVAEVRKLENLHCNTGKDSMAHPALLTPILLLQVTRWRASIIAEGLEA